MEKVMVLLIVAAVAVTACATGLGTVSEALDSIQDLDEKYGTSFKEEKVNTLTLTQQNIEAYLKELEALRNNTDPESEKQDRWIEWLFEAREQMLQAQWSFQQGWLKIGKQGRASDGFKCSEAPKIKQATLHLEDAFALGKNSTFILDSLMTENKDMKERIGIGDEKPAVYNSDFNGIYLEMQTNVFAMKRFCNITVPTKTLNFTKTLRRAEAANDSQRT